MHDLASPGHVPNDSEGSLPVSVQPGGIGGLCGQQLPPQTPTRQPVSAKSPEEGVTDVSGGTHSAQHLPEKQWLILRGAVRMPAHIQSCMCCMLLCTHTAFNSSCTRPLGHVATSHRKIAEMDPPK